MKLELTKGGGYAILEVMFPKYKNDKWIMRIFWENKKKGIELLYGGYIFLNWCRCGLIERSVVVGGLDVFRVEGGGGGGEPR